MDESYYRLGSVVLLAMLIWLPLEVMTLFYFLPHFAQRVLALISFLGWLPSAIAIAVTGDEVVTTPFSIAIEWFMVSGWLAFSCIIVFFALPSSGGSGPNSDSFPQ